MENVAQWKRWFREHDDLIVPVHRSADIRRAKDAGRTGIILGWQNTSALEDRAEFVEVFRDPRRARDATHLQHPESRGKRVLGSRATAGSRTSDATSSTK